jgi:hypothetical protein
MTRCPYCGSSDATIVPSRANRARRLASLPLLAFYVLGGLAGDQRGPILPLERECDACRRIFRRRSVIDDIRGRRGRSS